MKSETKTNNVAESGSSPSACSPRELAEKIATRLYTDGQKTLGTRLEIRLRNPDANPGRDNEKPLGGWCFDAVVNQITEILEENSINQRTKVR